MDFFTFIIIAVIIYNIFAKKNKPPQRRQPSAEEDSRPQNRTTREPARTEPKRGTVFENLERQIRESAERFEQELQGQPQRPKPAQAKTYKRQSEARPSTVQPPRQGAFVETEGVWGDEGRSDYDKYVSSQGTVGVEGVKGKEGTWGVEGREYARRQQERTGALEQSEIGAGSDYGREGYGGDLNFSPTGVMQGIIWAEVLKAPKGKRMMVRR